jgi:iron complex outermembrane recepter protein
MAPGYWRHGALMVAVLATALPLITQAASPPPSAPDALEEVIVTAERRVERTLDVPVSISVISAADIERLHATNLRDLEAAAPGLVITSGGSPGQTSIVLRGLPAMGSGSLVATVVDDVSVGSSASWTGESLFALDLLPYDVERIEILRGPQGTLYGANSMGGVLKYVTKDPSLTVPDARLGGDLFDIKNGGSPGFAARGSASAPLIVDEIAIRGSAYVQETPGYTANPLRGLAHENSLSQYGGRLALLWQPRLGVHVRLHAIYQRTDSDGDARTFAELLGTAQDPYYRPGGWVGGYLTYPHAVPEPFSTDVKLVSVTVDWQLPHFEVVSATGYSDKRLTQFQDFSQVLGYLQPLLDPNVTSMLSRARFYAKVDRFSQEIRLVSRAGQRFEWQTGVYYDNEEASNHQYVDALDSHLNLIPALNPFFAASVPSMYTETAVFGTLTYRINDRFDITGGLRWLTNRQRVESTILPNIYIPESNSIEWSADKPTTYAVSARWHPQRDTMTYLRIASGYRPGTPNAVLPGYPEIPTQTHSDTMANYEVGVKSELLNRRASLDLAVFKVNWSDLQLEVNTRDGRITYTTNAGKVTSKGLEVAAAYWPADPVHLTLAAAYSDAYATQAVPAAGILTGARLPSSPIWTAVSTLEFHLPNVGKWTSYLSGSWRYIAPQYSSLTTAPPVGLIPGYSWVDIEIRMVKGRYDIALYAKNLFDKRTLNTGGPYTANTAGPGAPVPPGPPSPAFGGVPVEPRVAGVAITWTL